MSDAATRPSIPPVAWFAVAVWCGSARAESVGWSRVTADAGASPLVIPAIAVAFVLLVAAIRRIVTADRPQAAALSAVLLVCAGLVAGGGVSVLQGLEWHRQSAIAADAGARDWCGSVEADPLPGAYGAVVRVRIEGGPLDGARVRVGWPEGTPVPELGRMVRFSAVLKPLPSGELWAQRMKRAGVCATGSAWTAETGRWRPGILGPLYAWRANMLGAFREVPGPGGDLAEGIVLGDRRRLIGTDTEEDFRILGLTHLVAVSGSHLALACAAVGFLGTMCRLPRRALIVLTVSAGAVYAIVTGLPFSALRSLLMLVVSGAGHFSGRRGDGVASLAVAVTAVIALEPWAVFDLGFQLSALAVGGLLLFGSIASAWMTNGITGPWRVIAATLALTLVAQLTTIPVVAAGFGMVSLMAPVANAAVGPLVSAALLLGLSGAVIGGVLPVLGVLGSQAAAAVLGAAAWVAQQLARLPGAAIAMSGGPLLTAGMLVAVVALWLWWPVPRSERTGIRLIAIAASASVALALGPAPARQASLTVLDVGQGDAILIRDSGRTMLVDVGPDPLALRRALARYGIRAIDVLVLTHAHADHTLGVAGVSGVAEVGWIGVPLVADEGTPSDASSMRDPMPGDATWRGPDTEVRPLCAGQEWRVGETVVRVLWPPKNPNGDLGTNDTSVVLLVSHGSVDVVLTGDAEEAAQTGMIADGRLSRVEILKVPHHGSSNGLTEEGLEAWAPDIALVSVGQGNDFGHPHSATMSLLQEAGVKTLRTDRSGDIIIEMGDSRYSVRASRRGRTAAVRARMGAGRAVVLRAPIIPLPGVRSVTRGCQGTRRAEAGLLDLRRRGAPARSRGPPTSRSHCRGRRSRLQLRGVRG